MPQTTLSLYNFKDYFRHFTTKRVCLIFLVFSIFLFTGCLGQKSNPQSLNLETSSPEKMTQIELSRLIQSSGDFLLIDVRTEGEYKQGHLPGAIVIPYNEFDTRYTEILDYRNKKVVLYCHVGGMGDYAGKVLLDQGFTNVQNLEGGIAAWRNSGGKII
jgi:rhodanese-related sulfurtransferase